MADSLWQPQIVAFVCQWCTYAGADLAGTSRMEYPANVRVVKLPCTGRIDPLFLIKALEQGADGVLVSGCHPGDCHYTSGNYLARRRFTVFRELLDFLGLEPERLRFTWISAAEAVKWTEVVDSFTDDLRQRGPHSQPWADPPAGLDPLAPEPAAESKRAHPETSAEYERTETSIRGIARELLETNQIDVFVGYGRGSLPEVTTPMFLTEPEKADGLVWNRHCLANLSVYVTRELVTRLGKVGLLVKGCDARSIVTLLREQQISRDKITIVGVPCPGMSVNGSPLNKCLACDIREPILFDVRAGGEILASPDAADPRDAEIAALEARPTSARWAYWSAQFARCVRCYACRAVCPMCYCDTCIVDKTRPQWVSPAFTNQGNLSWNITRAFHLAGRCSGCDECARICPADIRLDLINRKLATLIAREYGFRAGYDVDEPAALSTFVPEDRAEFIQ